jgi:glutamate-1-semialdehyde 2,1-aminomutase
VAAVTDAFVVSGVRVTFDRADVADLTAASFEDWRDRIDDLLAAENDVYEHVNALGDKLRAGIRDILADQAPGYTVVGTDSMFKTVFTRHWDDPQDDPCGAGCTQSPECSRYGDCPKTGADVDATASDRWDRLFRPAMREQGVLLTANQNEAQFVCAAHTEEDVERTLDAYAEALTGEGASPTARRGS